MTTVQRPTGERHLPDAGEPRRPWKQWVLSIVTFGVYAAIHHHRINRELHDFGIDVDPVKATLAFVPGCVLVVPYLVTSYRTGQRIAVAQETVDLLPTARAEVSALASLFTFLQVPYHQAELNKVWATQTPEGELS